MPAHRESAEGSDFIELHHLGIDPGFGRVVFLSGVLDQVAHRVDIAGREEHRAFGVESIATGPAGLLLIVFHRFRDRGVDDESNVRAVDSHAKGHGCNDDLDFLVDKSLLGLLALLVSKTCMVGNHRVASIL